MLATACPAKLGQKSAVVIALGKAHDDGHSSTVYCLNISDFEDEEARPRVEGNPYRLHDQNGWYIWPNKKLRAENIHDGSIIVIEKELDRYRGNTGKKMEMDRILSQLRFANCGSGSVAFRGIAEAFPDAFIGGKGLYQYTRPDPHCALISMEAGYVGDGRVAVRTRCGEVIDFNNRSRQHNHSGIECVPLPVQVPVTEDDVGDVILVFFSSTLCALNNYQAICEGLLLRSSSDQSEASMSSDEDHELSDRYPMSRRGICLIINNLSFHNKSDDRYGGEHDEQVLGELFEDELHFVVHVKHDLKHYQIQEVSEEYAAMDHSQYDAFVCIIMSHGGEKNTIKGINGKNVGVEELMSDFKPVNCGSLANKPKLFIIQACRGPSQDASQSSSYSTDSTMAGFATDSTLSRSACLQECDFLLASSTVPGYVSYRKEETGSIFIQTLVEVVRQYRTTEHLEDMLAIATRLVAERGSQVPCRDSSLRYKLYL